jgi:hypothetical protein
MNTNLKKGVRQIQKYNPLNFGNLIMLLASTIGMAIHKTAACPPFFFAFCLNILYITVMINLYIVCLYFFADEIKDDV